VSQKNVEIVKRGIDAVPGTSSTCLFMTFAISAIERSRWAAHTDAG